jgi:hypothetical protein
VFLYLGIPSFQEFVIEEKSHIPEFLGDGIPEPVDGLDIREYGHLVFLDMTQEINLIFSSSM